MQSELAESVLVPYGIENCKDLVQKVFTQIYSELINAVDNAPYESKDNQSYVILVSASERVRYLLMKLIVLLKWTKNLDIIENCQRMIFYDNNNVQQLTNSTNVLFAMIGRMHISLQPIFPLNSTISILSEGKYPFIPPVCDSKAPFLSKLSMLEGKKLTNRILKTRILTEPIPSFVSSIHVQDQVIICEEPNFFMVQFTNTQPTFNSTMTVTTLRIYNNNNTRMTVFPYFSSEQLSRIITTLNQVIFHETELSIILTKMYLLDISDYFKVIQFSISLLPNKSYIQSQKTTYGLTNFSYSIDHDILSFSFWKKKSLKREYSSNETTKVEITRQEDSETHLMKIVGKSNDYEFTIDLIHYRIFDIILKCIQYHQHTLLSEYREYLEKELMNSHYTLEENRLHDWIQEILIHIHSTPISLILSINSFTGDFELTLSDPSILSWCDSIIIELCSLIQAKYTIIEKLDQFFPYCVLYQIAQNYLLTSVDYQFVYSHYENEPCLYLPCLFTKEPPSSSIHYFILIRLLQNTCLPHIPSNSSLSPMNTSTLRPSKSAYHSINNQMNGLNEYSSTEEIGFDIDGTELPSESSGSDEDKIDPWMIDLIGVKEKRIYQPGSTIEYHIELLQNIHRKVVCSASSINSTSEEVNSSIDKLLPRLRYESLVSTISLLKQYKYITAESNDLDRRISQITCNNVSLTLKVEDSMEIRVIQAIKEQIMNRYLLKRGCYQNMKKRDNQLEYMLFPNASPFQFRSYLDSYSKILYLYQFLTQAIKDHQFTFCSSIEIHLSSIFSLVFAYRFPYDSNLYTLSILFPPWNMISIQWNINLPSITSSLQSYLLSYLHSKRQFDLKVLLLGIAAQYLYITIWRELQNQGIMKTDGTVLFYSIGLSRMELIIRFKEQVCYYVKLDLNNVVIEPKDTYSDHFLSTYDFDNAFKNRLTHVEKNSIQQSYTQAPMYIIDLINKRRSL